MVLYTSRIMAEQSFKDTLNLPHTEFPMRAQSAIEDPKMLNRWEQEQLASKAQQLNPQGTKFIVHDGPPYANGNIHLGHAYNKILKDIIAKSRRMMGMNVPCTPGWDCHGLPIELAVIKKEPQLRGIELMSACRKTANHWIAEQKRQFQALGVLMDWDNPYITMSPSYEAATVRAFGILFEKGFITRMLKTVPWCPSCGTVLASAEIEYKDRSDPSLYIGFNLLNNSEHAAIVIWTTTPWTIPLNQAILVHPREKYYTVAHAQTGKKYIIGASRHEALEKTWGTQLTILQEHTGAELGYLHAQHPLIPEKSVPIIATDSVSLTDGTGAVHCAPGCGPEDYEVGRAWGLEIYSPITPYGKYTADVTPRELAGVTLKVGQTWVPEQLAQQGLLVHADTITHPYPHCWRCHGGLIFRATEQWFCNLEHDNLRERALNTLENKQVAFVPLRSKNFLRATLERRQEWCISRQRQWGVPIPALLCETCNAPAISSQFITAVADKISREGVEYWARSSIEDLKALDPTLGVCTQCNNKGFKKEQDILDVWFDSGISHYAVLLARDYLHYPADVYLEGVDQHRGWFQSSLLTSMALEKRPCMKTIITHNHIVDTRGQKMSKSIGNIVTPQEIAQKIGTDGLRLWVSSIDIERDAVISDELLTHVADVFRKVRNTCRFLLSNLYDFDHSIHAITPDKLTPIDQYALWQLHVCNAQIVTQYTEFSFTGVFHTLNQYCAVQLSALYLDIIKDRLYTAGANSHERRSAQTTCYTILDTLTRLMAPIMSFTAEQVSDFYQKNKLNSIHLQLFNTTRSPFDEKHEKAWEQLLQLRGIILKAIEPLRAAQTIKHSLDARVTLQIRPGTSYDTAIKLLSNNYSREQLLQEWCIVSQAVLKIENFDSNSDVQVQVEHAQGSKCPRCWQWSLTVDSRELCKKCHYAVST